VVRTKLEYLSENIILILQQIMNQQDLCKLIYYNDKNPLSQLDLDLPASGLLLTKIFPYPADDEVVIEEGTQLRVWVPGGVFKGADISINDIYLDIVITKNLFLINDGKPQLRPYMIMKELIKAFDGISIDTVGRLNFNRFFHLITIGSNYNTFRIRAEMMMV